MLPNRKSCWKACVQLVRLQRRSANGRQPDMRKVAADLVLPSSDYAQLQEAGGTSKRELAKLGTTTYIGERAEADADLRRLRSQSP